MTACVDAPTVGTNEHRSSKASAAEGLADDPGVWVTMDLEALETLRSVSQVTALQSSLTSATPSAAGIAVVEARRSELPAMAQALHEERHRCGGFITHDSAQAAHAAADAGGRSRAAFAGDYTLDRAAVVAPVLEGISEASLVEVIAGLSSFPTRYYDSDSGVQAAKWLRGRWSAMAASRADVTVELVNHEWLQPSVKMTIRGSVEPDQFVVIGGHLDSIARRSDIAPGADDDASGIAALTEAARAALAADYRPQKSVVFYAYAAEEVGLLGSKDIVATTTTRAEQVIAVMQLDMVNHRGSDIDMVLLEDYTDPALTAFTGELIDTYLGATWELDSCGYGCSDHASWTVAGIPAVTPFESRVRDINRALHTPNDTLEVTNGSGEHAVMFAKLAAAYLIEVAKGTLGACTTDDQCGVGNICESGTCVEDEQLPDDAGVPETDGGSAPDASIPPGDDSDAGPSSSPDAGGPGQAGDDESAGGCAVSGRAGPAGLLSLLGLLLLWTRRRRR